MGGERETMLDKAQDQGDASTTLAGPGKSKLRVHQSGGEVHFHDDKAKLKASVPVVEWWKAWEKLRSGAGYWEWCDSGNGSILIIKTLMLGEPQKMEATVELKAAEFGANFAALNSFTKRR